MDDYNLLRFLDGQSTPYANYEQDLNEVKNGKKVSHWIWYIFPQLRGLGTSRHSDYYGIVDRHEAELYLRHPILGARLREITYYCGTIRFDESTTKAMIENTIFYDKVFVVDNNKKTIGTKFPRSTATVLLRPKSWSTFISVAALNRSELTSDNKIIQHLIEPTKQKMRTIMRIVLANGHDAIVLLPSSTKF